MLALAATAGVLVGSGLAGGGLLLACDDGNALILALILLHLRVGALSLVSLLLEMRGATALSRATAPASS